MKLHLESNNKWISCAVLEHKKTADVPIGTLRFFLGEKQADCHFY
jgi:hypothetical protein